MREGEGKRFVREEDGEVISVHSKSTSLHTPAWRRELLGSVISFVSPSDQGQHSHPAVLSDGI